MREVPVNLLAILIAGAVNMVIGFLWYSPMLFGKSWIKLSKISMEDMKKGQREMQKLYGLSFLVSLLAAFVLLHFITYAGEYYNQFGISLGVTSAIWTWLGFIMPVQLTDWIFQKKPFKLFLINTGYQLAAVLGMGIVLSMWK